MASVPVDRFDRAIATAFSRNVGGRLDGELVSNALLARSELVSSLLDPRRDVDAECHYPSTQEVTPEQYKDLYDRDPIACRVVQCLAKESWQVQPTVFESEDPDVVTPFEEAWDALQPMNSGVTWYKAEEASSVWEYLMRADVLSGIGHFGVLLMGFDDGKNLQEPVEGAMVTNTFCHARDCYLTKSEEDNLRKLPNLNEQEEFTLSCLAKEREFVINAMYQKQPSGDQQASMFGLRGEAEYKPSPMGTDQQYFGVQFGPSEQPSSKPSGKRLRLLFLQPFDESLVQVVRYEWNVNNPRFGMPVMYRITLNDPREQHSGIGLPMATVFVHWSRVIHLADNLNSSEIFGAPRMRSVLNRLLDLQKIYGASAEGYWQAAFTGLSLETHPQLGGDVTIDSADVRNQLENYVNSLQRYLALTGMSAHTLAPQVSDPSSQIDKHLEAICIQLGIPKRIFMGSERGELASSQDDASWNDRLKQRQQTYVTPKIIVPFVDRLIAVGVLPEPNYVEPSEEDPYGYEEQYDEGQFGEGQEDEVSDQIPELGEGGYADQQEEGQDGEDRTPASLIKNANPEGHNQYTEGTWESRGGMGSGGTKKSFIPNPGMMHPSDVKPLIEMIKLHDAGKGIKNGASVRLSRLYNAGFLEENPQNHALLIPTEKARAAAAYHGHTTNRRRKTTPILNAEGEQTSVRTKTGYSVKWPDLESNTELGKAQIATAKTQALAAYVGGNVEAVMPLMEYYTKVLGMEEREAKALVEASEAQQMETPEGYEQAGAPMPGAGGVEGAGPAVPGQPTIETRLNGAQLTAARDILLSVSAGTTPIDVAEELLTAVGIDRMVASRMAASAGKNAISTKAADDIIQSSTNPPTGDSQEEP